MSYSDLLKDPRWQRKRLEVLEAADWKCKWCGTTEKTLHVHHKVYRRGAKPWEYELSDLECLCDGCHEEITNLGKRLDNLVSKVKSIGRSEASKAIGYLSALASTDLEAEEDVIVADYECAEGVADFLGASAEDVIAGLVDGKANPHGLSGAMGCEHEARLSSEGFPKGMTFYEQMKFAWLIRKR